MASLITSSIGAEPSIILPILGKRTMLGWTLWPSLDDYLLFEYNWAYEVPSTGTSPGGPYTGTSSARHFPLLNTPFNVLLEGLWG